MNRRDYPYDRPGVLWLRIGAFVDESWSDCMDGSEVVSAGAEDATGAEVTVLIGPLEDQSALHSVLKTLRQADFN